MPRTDVDNPSDLTPIRNFFNGSFVESFNATADSDGVTVTMSLEQSGGGDLTMQFSDGSTTLDCTPAATIELTAGSDTSPQMNYIYVPKSTKAITKSTTGWPSAEHIKISTFFVPSATHVQAEGPYITHNWNDHLAGTDLQGHMTHMAERIRRDGAYYFSGIDPNGSDQDTNSSYLNYVGASESYFKATSGVIYQMHKHTVPAFDSSVAGDDIHAVNWNGDAYHEFSNLADIVNDANGVSLGNKYFNVFFFGVGNKTGEYSPMMCQLPTGSYTSQVSAENDVDGYDVTSIPREFSLDSSTGYAICRMTLRWTGGTTTLTHISTTDLRTANIAAGAGAAGTGTSFADNQFNVFNVADNTKIVDLDVSGVTTGTTRTLSIPDRDLDLQDPTFDTVRIIDDGYLYLSTSGTNAYIKSDGFEVEARVGSLKLYPSDNALDSTSELAVYPTGTGNASVTLRDAGGTIRNGLYYYAAAPYLGQSLWVSNAVNGTVVDIDTALYFRKDNVPIYIGAGDDSSISYTGSHLYINPREVGSGNVGIGTDSPDQFLHTSLATGNNYFKITASTGIAGFLLDGNSVGSSDYLVTANGTNVSFKNNTSNNGRFLLQNSSGTNILDANFDASYVKFPSDNQKIYLGAGDDVSHYWDGTGYRIDGIPTGTVAATDKIYFEDITDSDRIKTCTAQSIADLASTADEKVKISAGDTTTDYLINKLVAGNNITLDLGNAGGDENIEIAATDNFSYNNIVSGKTVTIPENQQMIVHGGITIDGTLVENGDLVLIG